MAIKEFEIGPQNYFEDGFFDGVYVERQNQSFATLTCEADRTVGFEFQAGFYFEQGFIEEGAFGVNSIIFTLEAEAMVVQEAEVSLGGYYQDGYYTQGYFQQRGSFFTLSAELERFGIVVEATALLESQFTQTVDSNKLLDAAADLNSVAEQTTINSRIVQAQCDFQALFEPNFSANAVRNTFAVLDSTAALATVATANRSADIALASMVNLSLQGDRLRGVTAQLQANFFTPAPFGNRVRRVTSTAPAAFSQTTNDRKVFTESWWRTNFTHTLLCLDDFKNSYYADQNTLTKLNPNGFAVWSRQLSATGIASAASESNSLYVVATANEIGKLTLSKHQTSNGVQVWQIEITVNGNPTNLVQRNKFLYLTVNNNDQVSLIKLDLNGAVVWSRQYIYQVTTDSLGQPVTPGPAQTFVGSVTDVKENTYLHFRTSGTPSSSSKTFITKVNNLGSIVWDKTVNYFSDAITPVELDFSLKLVVDAQSNIYFTGQHNNGLGSSAYYAVVNTDGNLITHRSWGVGPGTSIVPTNISSDITVNGFYWRVTDGFLRINSSNQLLWIKQANQRRLTSLFANIGNGDYWTASTGYIERDFGAEKLPNNGDFLANTTTNSQFITGGVISSVENAVGPGLPNANVTNLTLTSTAVTSTASLLTNPSFITIRPGLSGFRVNQYLDTTTLTSAFSIIPNGMYPRLADATLNAASFLEVYPVKTVRAVAQLQVNSALFGVTQVVKVNSAALSAEISVIANNNKITGYLVDINSTASLNAASNIFRDTSALLTSNTELTAEVYDFTKAQASLASDTALTAEVYDFTKFDADLLASSELTATAYDFAKAEASLHSQATVSCDNLRVRFADAELPSIATKVTVSIRRRSDVADLDSAFTLTASAQTVSGFEVDAAAEFTQTTLAVKTTDTTATVSKAAELVVDIDNIRDNNAVLAADTALTVDYERFRTTSSQQQVATELTAVPVKITSSDIALDTQSTLTVDLERIRTTDLTITANFTDTFTAVKTVNPPIDFASIATKLVVGNVIAFDSELTLIVNKEFRTLSLQEEPLILMVEPETRVNMVRKIAK
jgi:hypothetical protein